MNKPIKPIIIALAIILAVVIPISAYVAGSYIITSNHVSGTANSQATVTLTVNNTLVTIGDTLMLTAHLNDTKANVPIQFFNGTTALTPMVNTDNSGNAIVYYTVGNAYDLYAICTHP